MTNIRRASFLGSLGVAALSLFNATEAFAAGGKAKCDVIAHQGAAVYAYCPQDDLTASMKWLSRQG